MYYLNYFMQRHFGKETRAFEKWQVVNSNDVNFLWVESLELHLETAFLVFCKFETKNVIKVYLRKYEVVKTYKFYHSKDTLHQESFCYKIFDVASPGSRL